MVRQIPRGTCQPPSTPIAQPASRKLTKPGAGTQATVEDLDPPPALSSKPSDPISTALLNAYERDYTHLTVVSADTRALLGYLSMPRLKQLLADGVVDGGFQSPFTTDATGSWLSLACWGNQAAYNESMRTLFLVFALSQAVTADTIGLFH